MIISRRTLLIGLGATINDLATAMANVEGSGAGARSVRNNNPLNLVYAGQSGATGADSGGYAIFPTYAAGYQAGINQINLDLTRGTDITGRPTRTLSELLASWAPRSTDNPAAYAATVSSATGIDPNADLAATLANGGGLTPVGGDWLDYPAATSDPLGTSDTLASPETLALLAVGAVALWLAFR